MGSKANAVAAVMLGASLIVGAGVAEGLQSGRWDGQTTRESVALRAALEKLPESIDRWQRDEALVPGHSSPAATGWTYRRLRYDRLVQAWLVWGDRREMAAIGPQSCYPRQSLRMQGSPEPCSVQGEAVRADLTTAVCWSEEAGGRRRMRVFWTWWDAGRWTAEPTPQPRSVRRLLCLFVEEPLEQPVESSPALDFAAGLLPELAEVFAAASASAPPAEDPPET